MYERSYGYRYAEGQTAGSTTAIAKLIRRDIKQAVAEGLLPSRWKYSVRTEYFSGGSSIDVTVKGCADAWRTCEREQHGGILCGPDHQVLTDEADAARMTLERIHSAYNHDGSDTQVDYWDVNYYGHVEFQSAWSADFDAREKARKAARKAEAATAGPVHKVNVWHYKTNTTTVHLATEVDGKEKPICGAILRTGWTGPTDDEITCSRCAKKALTLEVAQ